MEDQQRSMDGNRTLWDAWTDVHEKSEFYDVEGFLAGRSRLKPIEKRELGDLRDRTMLHLQCHFGLDTLSWAREGVRVVGVDFSEKAIRLARSLNERAGLDARFLCSDVYSLPGMLDETVDVVFTSYGVLCWLPDLEKWAETIAHFLKPGGTFYMVEFHPFANMFDNEDGTSNWRMTEPYFHNTQPTEYPNEGSYADTEAQVNLPSFEWAHPISEVITSLIDTGLTLEFVHEHPHSTYQQFPFLKKHGEWDWRPPEQMGQPPLLYSIRAHRE